MKQRYFNNTKKGNIRFEAFCKANSLDIITVNCGCGESRGAIYNDTVYICCSGCFRKAANFQKAM